ncbi:MAG: hypothetical protein HOP30_22105 [Cyclobacteriaceae bacterium]|nr:hypothetical protein [Cyclobacteriaceae bacterium]
MNEKIIRFKKYTDIESLKHYILQRLKLTDPPKKIRVEFYDRLKKHIDQHENLQIIIQFDRQTIEEELKFRVKLQHIIPEPYPENYEMGNPHNRWIYEPIRRTDEEVQEQQVKINQMLQDQLFIFNNFLDQLQVIGKGRILIKDR